MIPNNRPLRCRLFGHRNRYDVVEDSPSATIIDVDCARSSCDYTERLEGSP